MLLEDIKNELNLKSIPNTFIKYESKINSRQSVITKKTLDTAFKFYKLEEETEFSCFQNQILPGLSQKKRICRVCSLNSIL